MSENTQTANLETLTESERFLPSREAIESESACAKSHASPLFHRSYSLATQRNSAARHSPARKDRK